MKPLILGSGSPRRREILDSLGLPFEVHVARVDETVREGEEADEYLERIVGAKLDAVRAMLSDTVRARASAILVADTSVVFGEILGKPKDIDEAESMIRGLGGATHEVHTRFCIAPPEGGTDLFHAETVITSVTFRPLFAGEARAYAASGEGKDKAGGYAAQGRAAAFITRIEGSYSNVVGLPACEVFVALRALGLA